MRISLLANFFNYQRQAQKAVFVSILNSHLYTFFLPLIVVIHLVQCYFYLAVYQWGFLGLAYANLITFSLSFSVSTLILFNMDQNENFRLDLSLMKPTDCWNEFLSFKFPTILKILNNYP